MGAPSVWENTPKPHRSKTPHHDLSPYGRGVHGPVENVGLNMHTASKFMNHSECERQREGEEVISASSYVEVALGDPIPSPTCKAIRHFKRKKDPHMRKDKKIAQ